MRDDWTITQGPVEVPSDRDSPLFSLRYRRGDVEREAFVHISGTAMTVATEILPSPVAIVVATRGQAAVEDALSRGHEPKQITADSGGGLWEEHFD